MSLTTMIFYEGLTTPAPTGFLLTPKWPFLHP